MLGPLSGTASYVTATWFKAELFPPTITYLFTTLLKNYMYIHCYLVNSLSSAFLSFIYTLFIYLLSVFQININKGRRSYTSRYTDVRCRISSRNIKARAGSLKGWYFQYDAIHSTFITYTSLYSRPPPPPVALTQKNFLCAKKNNNQVQDKAIPWPGKNGRASCRERV